MRLVALAGAILTFLTVASLTIYLQTRAARRSYQLAEEEARFRALRSEVQVLQYLEQTTFSPEQVYRWVMYRRFLTEPAETSIL